MRRLEAADADRRRQFDTVVLSGLFTATRFSGENQWHGYSTRLSVVLVMGNFDFLSHFCEYCRYNLWSYAPRLRQLLCTALRVCPSDTFMQMYGA